jgi:hypothetical protein
MKKIACALVTILAIAAGPRVLPVEAGAASSPLAARMTFANGASRTIALNGVGCSEAMCSRVAVMSRAEDDASATKTWLDTIAEIRDITSRDALFVLKNGTTRRLSVVHENRFLYYADQRGSGKIDLARITSIEFLTRR